MKTEEEVKRKIEIFMELINESDSNSIIMSSQQKVRLYSKIDALNWVLDIEHPDLKKITVHSVDPTFTRRDIKEILSKGPASARTLSINLHKPLDSVRVALRQMRDSNEVRSSKSGRNTMWYINTKGVKE